MKYFIDYTSQLERKQFKNYRIFKKSPYQSVWNIAQSLFGLEVIHINTAFNSGGVAEILKSQVPLEKSLGIKSHWLVFKGSGPFFEVTKKMHNLLQGKPGIITAQEKKLYLDLNKKAAQELSAYLENLGPKKILILHDPQPLAMIQYLENVPVISRIHIDLSNANKKALEFIKPFLLKATCIIISDKTFIPQFLKKANVVISYPATDPFCPKNIPLSTRKIKEILIKIGLDPRRPIMTQVSRFDPWKDPHGVVKCWQLVKKKIPGLQLVLAGLIVAEDDPEAKSIYTTLQRRYGKNPDIHLYGEKTPPAGISNEYFINALQAGSSIVLQKSIKEGFGLTVTEALFKYQPVIGGKTGGIVHQLTHGKNGFLVTSVNQAVTYSIRLLKNPMLKKSMGKAARASVEKNFIMSRLLLDHFKIYKKLMKIKTSTKMEVKNYRGQ